MLIYYVQYLFYWTHNMDTIRFVILIVRNYSAVYMCITETTQFVFSTRTVVISVTQFVFVYSLFTVTLAFITRVIAMDSAVAPVFVVHTPGIVHTRKRIRRTIEITCGPNKPSISSTIVL